MGTLGRIEDFGEDLQNTATDYGAQAGATIESKVEDRFDIEDRSSREGNITRRLEHFTAALPSTTWLMLAGGSLLGAIVLKALGKHHSALFVADLVPTFLLVGVYNKLVKIAGSDRQVAY